MMGVSSLEEIECETAIRNLYLDFSCNKILLALHNKKELNMTDLSAITSLSKQTTSTCVENLIKNKLIVDRRTCGLSSQRLVSLTEPGSHIAAALKKVQIIEYISRQPFT